MQTINYSAVGIMSGTSQDGLDIAYCTFSLLDNRWKYKINFAKTIPYKNNWKKKLSEIENKTAVELACLHSEYGHYIGKKIKQFLQEIPGSNEDGSLIVSSHGHTIFHQPENNFTFQLGNGAAIAAETSLPVVCDFRTVDVALGGQGAPLVPIGDKILFHDYEYCLNLGGIANISYDKKRLLKKDLSVRIAYDICPANMILNYLAKKLGKEYDKNGAIAKTGNIAEKLLYDLNCLRYYSENPPKSLGKEWVINEFFPVLKKHKISVADQMRTVTEHIASQVNMQFTGAGKNSKILVTGGGAHNKFLAERIKAHCPARIIIPDDNTVNFKEALIFAFLGVLRWRGDTNCLASVTGARKDTCGGSVYVP